MKYTLTILLAAFLFPQLYCQSPIWQADIEKQSSFKQLQDGNLFVRSGNTIALLDAKTGKHFWSHEMDNDNDPAFLDQLPIMYLQGKSWAVIDGLDGNIITQSDKKTKVIEVHYYWDQGRVVMELVQDKMLKVFNLNLQNLSESWTTEIGKAEKALFGLVNKGLSKKPLMTSEGELLIVDKKSAFIIDSNGVINKSFEFKDQVKVMAQNPEQSMVYLREKNKDLHFIDVKAKGIANTVTFDKKLSNIQIINSGMKVAVVKNKMLRVLDARTGELVGEYEYGSSIAETYLDEQSGKFLVISKKDIFSVSQEDGSILQQATLDQKFSKIYAVHDKLFIGNSFSQNELNIDDLTTRYEKSLRLTIISDWIPLNDGISLFITPAAQAKALTAFDTSGKKLWSREVAGSSFPSIDFVETGILVIGSTEANFFNSKTGKSMWKNSIKVEPSFTFVIDEINDRLVMFSEKKLHFFDFSSQGLTTSPDKFQFKDFDYKSQQPQIVPLEDKVFVKGSLTVFVADKQGVIEHKQTYKKSDNASGWLKLANAAVTIGTIASGNGEQVVTVYSGNQQVYKGGMVDGLNDNYAYAEGKRRERQQRQNNSSNRFPYIYTKLEDGTKGIIFINPKNGEHISEIVVDGKEPNYIVDEVEGVLFYENNGQLNAYQVQQF